MSTSVVCAAPSVVLRRSDALPPRPSTGPWSHSSSLGAARRRPRTD